MQCADLAGFQADLSVAGQLRVAEVDEKSGGCDLAFLRVDGRDDQPARFGFDCRVGFAGGVAKGERDAVIALGQVDGKEEWFFAGAEVVGRRTRDATRGGDGGVCFKTVAARGGLKYFRGDGEPAGGGRGGIGAEVEVTFERGGGGAGQRRPREGEEDANAAAPEPGVGRWWGAVRRGWLECDRGKAG